MRIPLFIVLFIIPFLAYGDLGSHFCIKATITTHKNTIHKGYFSLSGYEFGLTKDSDGYRYMAFNTEGRVQITEDKDGSLLTVAATEKQFFSDVHRILLDTIKLYGHVALIPFADEGDLIPAYMGALHVIAKNKIKTIVIHSLQYCSVLYSLLTPVSLQDHWITGKVYTSENLGQISCTYHALYFSNPSPSTRALVKALQLLIKQRDSYEGERTPAQYKQYNLRIDQKILELKKVKVLVVYTCSC